MSILVNVVSAIGNNSSVYPLLVRDCGIENPAKVIMTYNQNLKESKQMANNATRERAIDEYGTSAVWLGGIPLMDWVCNKAIKKLGYNPDINPALFKENTMQGIKLNIEKFKESAPEQVKELKKVLANKKVYERLLAGKFVLSTSIPIAIMGFVLPKINFSLTDKIQKQQDEAAVERKSEAALQNSCRYQNNFGSNTNKEAWKNIAFKGGASALANMSTVNKMAITDGGLTVGRVYTARNKFEKLEMAFKMIAMMFLNFVAPFWVAKCFDGMSNLIFKTNVNLDPKLLNDKNFLNKIETNTLKLPKENLVEFFDKNPNSVFSKIAGIKYLDNGVRDPRLFIDEKKVKSLKEEVEKFATQARQSGVVKKFAKKALMVKSGNILANVAFSSFLLAAVLPKVTFILRKKITQRDAEPGLVR